MSEDNRWDDWRNFNCSFCAWACYLPDNRARVICRRYDWTHGDGTQVNNTDACPAFVNKYKPAANKEQS